jgi:hypothetical protein
MAKPAKTIHPLAIIDSMKAQNEAVFKLISTVSAVLAVSGDSLPPSAKQTLEKAAEECRAAMWPDD